MPLEASKGVAACSLHIDNVAAILDSMKAKPQIKNWKIFIKYLEDFLAKKWKIFCNVIKIAEEKFYVSLLVMYINLSAIVLSL